MLVIELIIWLRLKSYRHSNISIPTIEIFELHIKFYNADLMWECLVSKKLFNNSYTVSKHQYWSRLRITVPYNMKTWELLTTRWELFVLLIVFVTAGTKVSMALQCTTTSFTACISLTVNFDLYFVVIKTSCWVVLGPAAARVILSKALVTCHSCLLIWTVTFNTQKRYSKVV